MGSSKLLCCNRLRRNSVHSSNIHVSSSFQRISSLAIRNLDVYSDCNEVEVVFQAERSCRNRSHFEISSAVSDQMRAPLRLRREVNDTSSESSFFTKGSKCLKRSRRPGIFLNQSACKPSYGNKRRATTLYDCGRRPPCSCALMAITRSLMTGERTLHWSATAFSIATFSGFKEHSTGSRATAYLCRLLWMTVEASRSEQWR